jgi:hypothetical protein
MTMDPIFLQPGDIAPLSLPTTLPASKLPAIPASAAPIPENCELDRISRLAAIGPEDMVAGLMWLAMNFPAVCDAMLDKTEFDAVDDEDPCQEPEPFCAECGARYLRTECLSLKGMTADSSWTLRLIFDSPSVRSEK